MVAVIFEAEPSVEGRDEYLETAAGLRALLAGMPGFLSIERFQSLSEPGKLLSLSFWESEEAVAHWRNLPERRAAQARGRAALFHTYRIRIASVIRDYGMDERSEAPADSRQAHDE